MCTIVLAHRVHPEYPLIVAANRDEFYARPTAAASFWSDDEDVLAGRDLRAGGTWLGITRGGRFAALTNLRDGAEHREGAPTRGGIVAGFLRSRQPVEVFLDELARDADRYDGFNLLVRDRDALAYYSNRGQGPQVLPPGLYAISNALLGAEWPKIRRAREALDELTRAPRVEMDALIKLLADPATAPDDLLPHTGIDLEWERALSAIFIKTADYGTCSSTAILVDNAGHVEFAERRASSVLGEDESAETRFAFKLS